MSGVFKSKKRNKTENDDTLKRIEFGRTFAHTPYLFTSIIGLDRDQGSADKSFWDLGVTVKTVRPSGADISLSGMEVGVRSVTVSWMACL